MNHSEVLARGLGQLGCTQQRISLKHFLKTPCPTAQRVDERVALLSAVSAVCDGRFCWPVATDLVFSTVWRALFKSVLVELEWRLGVERAAAFFVF